MKRSLLLIMMLFALSSTCFAAEAKFIAPGETAPGFTMKDIQDKVHSLKDHKGEVIVLLQADKKGQKRVGTLTDKLRKLYNREMDKEGEKIEKITMFAVANMSSVPKSVHKMVKKMILKSMEKKEDPVTLLMDMEGKIAKEYGYKKGHACAYVVDREGKIAFAAAIEKKENKANEKKLIGILNELTK